MWQAIAGFFDTIMQPIYHAVSFLVVGYHKVVTPIFGYHSGWSWTIAIIMLTITVRLLMMPLYAKQLNASRAQQALAPKVAEIREKHAGNKDRINQETMRLYETSGVNPAASCLPLLVQMPIFLSLFQVLNGAARGVPKGYFFTTSPDRVRSLQQAEIFGSSLASRFWPMTDGFGATQILALILIIAMTGVLLWQQIHMMRRNMPPAALEGPMGQQQKMMIYMMPVMFAVGGVSMPIGVLVYWLASNLWTLGQQTYIIRNFPTPGTPAYVDWEERLKEKGLDPKEIERKRIEKGQSKKMKARAEAARQAQEAAEARKQDQPRVVTRQQVSRQTVRKSVDGTQQVVQRQQPRTQARKARKKK